MDAVKAFTSELSALYDVKPPISKAKMNSLTRGAIKAIKFYKHVVQSVEKFIQKCKPEYKVPGLYVIDSIVRQSRHQFGVEKDVFAPRFAKNMQLTFLNLLKCPPEDKSKVIRVLNLWQKNAVFPPEVIQPLFDLADPNHPIHKDPSINTNGAVASTKPIDPAWLAQTKLEAANMVNANKLLGQSGGPNQVDATFLDQLQHLQQLLLKKQEKSNESQSSVKFDKKLLDFDYGEEEDDDMMANSPAAASVNQHNPGTSGSLESLGLLLTNPEVLRQLQTLQQTMQNSSSSIQHEMEEKMRKLQQMKQQEDEFDKHLAQTVSNLPFASECELKPSDIIKPNQAYNSTSIMQQDMSQPPPGYPPAFVSSSQSSGTGLRQSINQKSPLIDERQDSQDYQITGNLTRRDSSSVEIVNLDSIRSQSRSPERFRGKHSRSRSPRHRNDRGRDRDRDRKSRSRSRSRRQRSRSRDRKRDDSREREKISEEEREKQRERRKRGLPMILREKMSVCSTTLWVGHLSKLVHQEELSDTFGEFGDIVSIDLISPRGCAFICMNRRQDAFRALTKLKNHKMQGKAITLAWAPGKGVKGKEWKDYWEVELGVSYIPWNKLNNVTEHDLESLEEGGMIDEDTLPPRLIGKLKHSTVNEVQHSMQMGMGSTPIPTLTDGMVNVMPVSSASQLVDTSQPPPIRATASSGLMPPTSAPLSMMPPGFPMTGVSRMLGPMGLQMAHGLMPNVPIGVPPPNMQSLLGPPGMMQSMLNPTVNSPFGTGVGILAQIPMPAPAAPSDKSNSTGMPLNVPPMGVPPPPTGETNLPNLPMIRQSFGVGPPPPPMQMQLSQPDDMDVEMEDVMPQQNLINPPTKDKPNLSDQLLAVMGKGNSMVDGDRDMRDRDQRRDRDRERGDNQRERGRGRDRGRDRRRSERDDRRDDRRDRDILRQHDGQLSMTGLLQESDIKKDKLCLTERLRQLSESKLTNDERIDRICDRGDRSIERTPVQFDDAHSVRRPDGGPPSLMDLPKFSVPSERDFSQQRGPDYRQPQDIRDFPRNERDRVFVQRGGSGVGPGRGPIDDFTDPRILGPRFPDEFDRLGPNGPRPDDFDLRLHPREEFDRPEMRRHPMDDYEAERIEFEMRQREREGGFDPRITDGFDPRLHPDHPDFDPRRREFFGLMEPGPPGFGSMMGNRGGPRGPMVSDAFARSTIGPRGHGPPLFHPRGMGGPRGNMRPGMRPFGPRGGGGGPPFDPREGDAFFRSPFDDGRGPMRPFGGGGGPPHPMGDAPWRGPENGPWTDGNGLDSDDIPRDNHRDNSKGHGKHQDRDRDRDRNLRNRKSRWGNASPSHDHDKDPTSDQDKDNNDKKLNDRSKDEESWIPISDNDKNVSGDKNDSFSVNDKQEDAERLDNHVPEKESLNIEEHERHDNIDKEVNLKDFEKKDDGNFERNTINFDGNNSSIEDKITNFNNDDMNIDRPVEKFDTVESSFKDNNNVDDNVRPDNSMSEHFSDHFDVQPPSKDDVTELSGSQEESEQKSADKDAETTEAL